MVAAKLVGRLAVSVALTASLAVRAGPVWAAEAPTVRELVEVADIEALSASPDGQRLAFQVKRASIERNTYQIDWYVADLRTGAVRRIADAGAPLYSNGTIEEEPAIWSPDGRFIHYRALVDDRVGLWRAAVDGSGSRPLVQGGADVETVEQGPDGRSLVYVTGPSREEVTRAERQEYDDGILVDATIDLGQQAFRGGWVRGRRASERLIGNWFARAELLWRTPRTRHRLDLDTLSEAPPERQEPPTIAPLRPGNTLPSPTATSPSGDVVVATAGEGDSVRIEVRRSRGETITCTAALCRTGRVATITWRPEHDEILFTRQDHHSRQTILAWTLRTGQVRVVAAGEGQLSGGRRPSVPCTFTPAFAICVTAAPVSPPKLVRLDLDRGGTRVLHDPNPELRQRASATVEHLSWALPDGRTATGVLLYDAGRTPSGAPLFINYYVCRGFERGGFGDRFPLLTMVGAGFVVACLNSVPNAEADGVGRFRDSLTAIRGLVDQLARRGMIDRARVGMGGFSFGSEATMWVAMNSDLLAAAAVASGQYETSMYWMSTVRGRDYAEPMRGYFGLGSPDETPGQWQLMSPALNIDRIHVPLLMQLPEQEARGTVELYSRLSNSATPVEMYVFPDEAHLVVQPRHMLATYQRNLDWFRYWLQDYSEPDPAAAVQYQRWRELRERSRAARPAQP